MYFPLNKILINSWNAIQKTNNSSHVTNILHLLMYRS